MSKWPNYCQHSNYSLKGILSTEKDHRSTELIKSISDCLDIRKIMEEGKDDAEFNEVGYDS